MQIYEKEKNMKSKIAQQTFAGFFIQLRLILRFDD